MVDSCRQCIQCQNLAIGNRGSGGQLSVARPPGRVRGAPQARQAKKKPGRVIPGDTQCQARDTRLLFFHTLIKQRGNGNIGGRRLKIKYSLSQKDEVQ